MHLEAQPHMGGRLPMGAPPRAGVQQRMGGHLPMGASTEMGVQQQMDGRGTYSGLQNHEDMASQQVNTADM